MQQSHKLSFYIILTTVFLLPIFFIPGGALTIASAKSFILVLGVVLAMLAFAFELWRDGKLVMPKHYILLVLAALPLVYLLSALLATPSSLSLFGYNFEVGTFGFVLLGSILLVLVSSIFADTSRLLQAFSAVFVALILIALFALVKVILGGDALALGNFFGNTGNPLGNWTDIAMGMSLLATLSLLTLGMIPMKGFLKILLYVVFLLSVCLLVVMNFQAAFILTLVVSVLLFFYFSKLEKKHGVSRSSRVIPVFVGLISLVFLINPVISGEKTLSDVVSGSFGVTNTEVRPSFSATLGISKAVLSQVALLGSGPNTFGRDWLIHKGADINATPFWSVAFPYGAGFLPTQIATTGILGSAIWLAFLVLLIGLGVKSFSRLPDSRAERFAIVFSYFATAFLWVASFIYAPSPAMLSLTFVFTGLFLASLLQAEILPVNLIDLKRSSQTRSANILVLTLVVIVALSLGWVSYGKTVSSYHFNKAIMLSNAEDVSFANVEKSIAKAIEIAPQDIYFVGLSRLNFSLAQMAANNATGTPEENRAIFDESIKKSIEAARLAVSANPSGYENWVALGTVFSAIVPKPLAVEGAYENALFAYNEAIRRNPSNPELPLLLARLELNNEKVDEARSYIRRSIALKEDYADAYLMLAQLEQASGNTAEAIASAEKLVVLLPENAGLHFELGLLKYSSQNYSEAVESLNRALALAPEYANAKYYLGLSLANLGSFAEAQTEFESLLEQNPDNEELMSALEAVKKNKIPASPQPTAASTPSQ